MGTDAKHVRRLARVRRFSTIAAAGVMLQSPLQCNLQDFTTTTTTTLDGREVVTFLVRSAILTPLDNLVTAGIDRFFDQFIDDNDA